VHPGLRIYWTQNFRHVFHIEGAVLATPNSLIRKLYPFFLLSALFFLPARPLPQATAQSTSLPALNTADPLLADLFHRSGSTGMVVVLVRGNQTWMQGYGQTKPGSHTPPNANSLFRLCSLTKIMTSDVLAKMVADGQVSLSDPLQKFAPANVKVPTLTIHGEAERPITLRDLATHTAGFPREIAYPSADSGHFTFPDYAFRWQWLPGYRLRTTPGYAVHYSNIGYDLLADALSSAAHEPYPRLFYERIAKPLALTNTTVTPTEAQCDRLLIGGRNQGPCSNTTAAAGSGGMYSTASDMTRWLSYLLGLPGAPMHQDPAAMAMYIPASDLRWMQGVNRAGIPTGMGLGWVYLSEPKDPDGIIEKTGGGAGFTTYIALNPEHHIGIFLAATDGRRAATGAAPVIFRESNDLIAHLAGFTPRPTAPLEVKAVPHHHASQVRQTSLHKHRKTTSKPLHQATHTTVTSGQ
jgi:serine-type D-Ala-D-Ala carboxypeptidase/endopeptidase